MVGRRVKDVAWLGFTTDQSILPRQQEQMDRGVDGASYRTVYNEQPERDSLNDPNSCPEPLPTPDPSPASAAAATGARSKTPRYSGKLGTGRTLLGILTSGRSSSTDMLEHTEPFVHLWILLSSLYGRLLVILMVAFCITEVMDNSVKLLSLQVYTPDPNLTEVSLRSLSQVESINTGVRWCQCSVKKSTSECAVVKGIFLMYLYVGSIAVIICIYIWVLIDSCASLHAQSEITSPAMNTTDVENGDPELGGLSFARFGSLKRAHISRARTSATSFYLRVGALAFGLGTLVFNGLEMAMHSMMEGACLNDVVFVHPILHGLFTFLQMHFLFVNSQSTPILGARVASNIPTPLQLRGFPRSMLTRHQRDLTFSRNITSAHIYQPLSDNHISQVVSLHECLNTNSLGQLWTSSMPFLYPFIIQFSLIAAAVTFIMGQNVGLGRIYMNKHKKLNNNNINCGGSSKGCSMTERMMEDNWSVDCGGASKGLFLGLLCLVAGIVVIIIFLVVKEDLDFPVDTIFWLTSGALAAILSLSCIMTVVGLVQIRRLSYSGKEPSTLDSLLATVTATGVQLYSVFGIVVGASGLAVADIEGSHAKNTMLLSVSVLQLIQACGQSTLISEGMRRASLTRYQMIVRPGRQIITFLLCSNAVLWAYDTFVTQSWMSQELQLRFFGVLAWGIVSRIGLPLLVFYRFHSCVLLLEVWKRSYRTPLLDPGN
uniref:Uncharacterized protein n=1 Tax=Timema poppense TaxID=170557 RepID=A0A7R9CU68_TIMPO|nr:unnamed protein product [Timema poppensis]